MMTLNLMVSPLEIGLFYTPIDLVFHNHTIGNKDRPQGQFVNDLLQTEFHRLLPFDLEEEWALSCLDCILSG